MVALSVLCGASPESELPEDDATLGQSTVGDPPYITTALLLRHGLGTPGGPAPCAEDPFRDHGLAHLDEPPHGRRVG
jgi:hypothetical protein